MARWWLIVAALWITLAGCEYQHEGGRERRPSEKERSRSASAGRERGSFQRLSSLMNRTEARRDSRRRGDGNLNKLLQMNRKQKARPDDMMNDNEGAIAINPRTAENDTNSLTEKMKELRVEGPTYEAVNKEKYVPQVKGVFCNFEGYNESRVDMCTWQWNATVSSHGLGFSVATAADVVRMNESTRGLKFSGPGADADGNVAGHFLYLPVDPTMENMVIKSPPFRGLSEFCKFEAKLHQSKMQNASIRLISESTLSEVQWILQEVAGNNYETWHPLRFVIGKMQQEVRIIVEVTRPNFVSLGRSLPHIAIDNVRMVECLPEPPVFNGECQHRQLKCTIMNKDSCIKRQQVCDLVKDCDDGNDEYQNCDKMPFGSYCNFEAGACGFVNIPQPILKWSRHSGPTPTDKTGPNYDHTCGPPDPYAATPPLAPARSPPCAGYYFFVNMNVTGPNKERADFASTAVMRTVLFNPPPRVHGDAASKYYNCCMVSGNPSGGAVGLLNGEWELGAGLKIDGDAASKYYNCCMVSGNPSGGAVGLLYGEWELGAGLKIHGDAASKYYNCCMVSGNPSGGAVGLLNGEWELGAGPKIHGDAASKYYNCCMVSGNPSGGAVGLLYGEWELGAGLKIDGDAASKYYNCCMVSGNPSGGAVGLLNGEWELGAGPKIHGDAASK
ncbi:unnamed protein product, partial [Iphiclides podalirius]